MSTRVSYTVKEKLRAVAFAETHGNRAAGREFGTNEVNVRKWRKMKNRLQSMPKGRCTNRGGKAHFPELETDLTAWIRERRQEGIPVSTTEIRLKALAIAKRMGVSSFKFKASVCWCHRYLKRNQLSIRRRTNIAQKLPKDFDDKLVEFQRFVGKIRRQNNYELSQIGNADQTPLTFDLPSSTTIDDTGASSVSIKTTGNEKNRFTVMLGCTADGGKLPPYIIFKRKTLPKSMKFPKGVIVKAQAKGWMDDALTKDWVEQVWQRRPGALLKKKSLLVLDAFRCHRSDGIKDMLKKGNSDLCIIPGGMTSMLQPLDVSVNKPMKVKLRHMWTEWMAEGEHSYTKGGLRRKPELDVISGWILKAWEELDPEIIIRAFQKCCISNNLDGTRTRCCIRMIASLLNQGKESD